MKNKFKKSKLILINDIKNNKKKIEFYKILFNIRFLNILKNKHFIYIFFFF
jgi:hypothetical protein